MRIELVMSDWAMSRPVTPDEIWTSSRGLTGSEVSFFKVAEGLSRLGHDVTCRANVTRSGEVLGVPCARDFSSNVDAAIAWIDPAPLRAMDARMRVLNQQVNDFHYCPGWQDYVDIVTSPSTSHRNYLRGFNEFEGRWEILPNGVDVSTYRLRSNSPRSHSLVYASSPDRGLHWLLQVYPDVKKHVPDVTLDVYYDWRDFYESVRGGQTETSYRLRYCKEMLDRLSSHGVRHHGSVSRQQLVQVFSEKRVLSYPCDTVSYTEGFSVTSLEAAVSGCVPALIGTDALEEVYGRHLDVIPSPFIANEGRYVDALVRLLVDDSHYRESQVRAQGLASLYSWDVVCKKLDEIIQI